MDKVAVKIDFKDTLMKSDSITIPNVSTHDIIISNGILTVIRTEGASYDYIGQYSFNIKNVNAISILR